MIAVMRRVFVTGPFAIEAQHRASGSLRSICDRWSGLLATLKGKDRRSPSATYSTTCRQRGAGNDNWPPPNGQSAPSTRVWTAQ